MNENVIPPILLYTRYLNIASVRFNKTMNECRNLYGTYTIYQWNELLYGHEQNKIN